MGLAQSGTEGPRLRQRIVGQTSAHKEKAHGFRGRGGRSCKHFATMKNKGQRHGIETWWVSGTFNPVAVIYERSATCLKASTVSWRCRRCGIGAAMVWWQRRLLIVIFIEPIVWILRTHRHRACNATSARQTIFHHLRGRGWDPRYGLLALAMIELISVRTIGSGCEIMRG